MPPNLNTWLEAKLVLTFCHSLPLKADGWPEKCSTFPRTHVEGTALSTQVWSKQTLPPIVLKCPRVGSNRENKKAEAPERALNDLMKRLKTPNRNVFLTRLQGQDTFQIPVLLVDSFVRPSCCNEQQ